MNLYSIFVYIFIGASDAIKNILKLLICQVDCKQPGVLIPIPQYPLYSATLAEFDMAQIGYYLDESQNWALSVSELQVIFRRFFKNLLKNEILACN